MPSSKLMSEEKDDGEERKRKMETKKREKVDQVFTVTLHTVRC